MMHRHCCAHFEHVYTFFSLKCRIHVKFRPTGCVLYLPGAFFSHGHRFGRNHVELEIKLSLRTNGDVTRRTTSWRQLIIVFARVANRCTRRSILTGGPTPTAAADRNRAYDLQLDTAVVSRGDAVDGSDTCSCHRMTRI